MATRKSSQTTQVKPSDAETEPQTELIHPVQDEVIERTAQELVAVVREALAAGDLEFIASDREIILGEIAFYAPELRPLLVITGGRASRLPWIDRQAWRGRNALLVSGSPPIWPWFREVEPLGEHEIPVRGRQTRRIVLSRGIDYQPVE